MKNYSQLTRKDFDALYPEIKVWYLSELAKAQNRLIALCERCYSNEAVEIHHMAGRAGERYLDVKNFKGMCAPCHREVESRRREAASEGFLKRR